MAVRRRHRSGAAAHPGRPRVHLSRRARAGGAWRPASPIAISDLELASRLSFFLWSSIPDDAADRPRRARPAARARPCSSSRCGACWRIRSPTRWSATSPASGSSVRSLTTNEPVVNLFPDFDDNLRDAYQREIELFFGSVVQEDRSVLDLLDADYTFVNERLAKHYGIPNVYGPQFRRVTLPAVARHAPRPARQGRAADGDVERGAHVAGDARQVVPADVPRRRAAAIRRRTCRRSWSGSSDTAGNAKTPTMRQLLEAHRGNPTCASCHQHLRAGGPRARELRRRRRVAHARRGTADRRQRACSPTARRSTASSSLRKSLRAVLRSVRASVAEKLLTYALGRGVEYQDMPLVRTIVRDAAAEQLPVLVAGDGHRQERHRSR